MRTVRIPVQDIGPGDEICEGSYLCGITVTDKQSVAKFFGDEFVLTEFVLTLEDGEQLTFPFEALVKVRYLEDFGEGNLVGEGPIGVVTSEGDYI